MPRSDFLLKRRRFSTTISTPVAAVKYSLHWNSRYYTCILLKLKRLTFRLTLPVFLFLKYTLSNLSWELCSQTWTTTVAKFTKALWKIIWMIWPASKISILYWEGSALGHLNKLGYSSSFCKYCRHLASNVYFYELWQYAKIQVVYRLIVVKIETTFEYVNWEKTNRKLFSFWTTKHGQTKILYQKLAPK
jgi:hypothetical protein